MLCLQTQMEHNVTCHVCFVMHTQMEYNDMEGSWINENHAYCKLRWSTMSRVMWVLCCTQMEYNDMEGSWINEKHELEKRLVELEARCGFEFT